MAFRKISIKESAAQSIASIAYFIESSKSYPIKESLMPLAGSREELL